MLARVVARAHAAGLRVSTHAETAADFHNALMAEVDEINHLPGFRPERGDWSAYDGARYRLSEEDPALAARRRVVVVTTLTSAAARLAAPQAGDRTDEVRATLQHNLEILKKHGAHLAIGSDSYGHTAQAEGLAVETLRVFENLTLLKMWCEATPVAIFPDRKLGALREGHEASFLALPGDPLVDFSHVTRVEFRVKQGVPLPPPA